MLLDKKKNKHRKSLVPTIHSPLFPKKIESSSCLAENFGMMKIERVHDLIERPRKKCLRTGAGGVFRLKLENGLQTKKE
jgi:hypothetical protein